MKREINSDKIAKAIGPYSHSVMAEGKFIFISGQIALDIDGNMKGDTVKEQTEKALSNLKLVVENAGGSIESIVKTTVLMKDLSHFTEMNTIYAEFFGNSKPARAAYEVSRLPKDALIEIEAIAVI
jgi:2-iminobutanoate/2-iminopropanoate deaminase